MTRQRDGSFVFLPIPYSFSSNTIRVSRLPARKCNTKSVFDEHNAFSRGANNPEGADKDAKNPEGADKWRGRHGRANVRKARKAEEGTGEMRGSREKPRKAKTNPASQAGLLSLDFSAPISLQSTSTTILLY